MKTLDEMKDLNLDLYEVCREFFGRAEIGMNNLEKALDLEKDWEVGDATIVMNGKNISAFVIFNTEFDENYDTSVAFIPLWDFHNPVLAHFEESDDNTNKEIEDMQKYVLEKVRKSSFGNIADAFEGF